MTATRTAGGVPLHFPPTLDVDDDGLIKAPPESDLEGIADAVHVEGLLLFTHRLIGSAKRRGRKPRWYAVNVWRLQLARACLDRALSPSVLPIVFREH